MGLPLVGALCARQIAGRLTRNHRWLMRVAGVLLITAAFAEPVRLLLEG